MSGYRKEWPCCGDETYTEAWEPERCPFCELNDAKDRIAELETELEAAQAPASGEVEWRDVAGYDGVYEISSNGDLRSKRTGRIQAKSLVGAGYVKACLHHNGNRKQTSIHRLVAEAFLPSVPGKTEVNHKNGDKTDNRVENLEWSSRTENTNHARYELGRDVKPVIATDVETGEEQYFPSIMAASRAGFLDVHITGCISGRRKTHRGKTWRVAEFIKPTHPPAKVPEGFVLAERHFTPEYVIEAGKECLRALEKAGCNDTRTIVQAVFQDMLLAIERNATPTPATTAEAEWVKCEDRLPTQEDEDFNGEVWAYDPYETFKVTLCESHEVSGPNVTHWKPTGLKRPNPPTAQEGE